MFLFFRAKSGLNKTNNQCEIWHKQINTDLKVDDKYKHFYKLIDVLRQETLRQETRFQHYLNGTLASEVSDESKRKYNALALAIERYEKLTQDSLKLKWLFNITGNFDINVELDNLDSSDPVDPVQPQQNNASQNTTSQTTTPQATTSQTN